MTDSSGSRLPAACGFIIMPPAWFFVEIRLRLLHTRHFLEQRRSGLPEKRKEHAPEPGFYTPVPVFFMQKNTTRGGRGS